MVARPGSGGRVSGLIEAIRGRRGWGILFLFFMVSSEGLRRGTVNRLVKGLDRLLKASLVCVCTMGTPLVCTMGTPLGLLCTMGTPLAETEWIGLATFLRAHIGLHFHLDLERFFIERFGEFEYGLRLPS